MIFGSKRDYNLFNRINRELLSDIVEQEVVYHKISLEQTNTNLYGESLQKTYFSAVKLNCLITRGDQVITTDEFGPDLGREASFAFLRTDLEDTQVVPEVGDLILYQNGYYQIDNITANQYLFGKNPDFPNETNPLNPGLGDFGSNYSVLCKAHYEPADKFGITKERL